MTKTAVQAAKTKAAFTWDPNADQTYNLDQDLVLPGTPNSFNKANGKSFTMDAPTQKLTLQITPADSGTVWGAGPGTTPSVIRVKRGTFIYDATNTVTDLFFGDLEYASLETTLTVENDAQFLIKGGSATNGAALLALSNFNINVADEGLIDINCNDFGLTVSELLSVRIVVGQFARMSVACASSFTLLEGTVDVSSSPGGGSSPGSRYSLSWVTTEGQIDASMSLRSTFMTFSGASSGFLRCPALAVDDTRIRTGDTAACWFQFDAILPQNSPQFILGPGSTKMQFDAYSNGKYPFDFVGKTYPQGLFEITSGGTVNGGSFVIRGTIFDANAIVTRGYVAIDGEIQHDFRRLSSKQDANTGYVTVKQIA